VRAGTRFFDQRGKNKVGEGVKKGTKMNARERPQENGRALQKLYRLGKRESRKK